MPRTWIVIGSLILLCGGISACGSSSAEPEFACQYEQKISSSAFYSGAQSGYSSAGDWEAYCVTVDSEEWCNEITDASTDCYGETCSNIRYRNISVTDGPCPERTVADEVVTSPGTAPLVSDPVPASSVGTTPTTSQLPAAYERVDDATGMLHIDIPVDWSDRIADPFIAEDGSVMARIIAAPELAAYDGSYWGAGIGIYYAPASMWTGVTVDDWLDSVASPNRSECILEDESATADEARMWFVACGDARSSLLYYGMFVNGGEERLLVAFQWLDEADLLHLNRALESLFPD